MSLAFPGASVEKNLPANAGDMGSIPGQEDPLEKEMATHSSILAWEIPCTGKPGRLQSMGFSQKEYWSGLPLPSPGALSRPGIEPMSPALAGEFFSTEAPGKANDIYRLS